MDVDGENYLKLHPKMLAKKYILRESFNHFHDLFRKLDCHFIFSKGIKVELESGFSTKCVFYSEVLASNIIEVPYPGKVINVEAFDLVDNSVMFARAPLHSYS